MFAPSSSSSSSSSSSTLLHTHTHTHTDPNQPDTKVPGPWRTSALLNVRRSLRRISSQAPPCPNTLKYSIIQKVLLNVQKRGKKVVEMSKSSKSSIDGFDGMNWWSKKLKAFLSKAQNARRAEGPEWGGPKGPLAPKRV